MSTQVTPPSAHIKSPQRRATARPCLREHRDAQLPVARDMPLQRSKRPHDEVQQRRLTAAVGAEDRDATARTTAPPAHTTSLATDHTNTHHITRPHAHTNTHHITRPHAHTHTHHITRPTHTQTHITSHGPTHTPIGVHAEVDVSEEGLCRVVTEPHVHNLRHCAFKL